ncbi:MAG: coproporphyrinogen-III oxidase family protein, partial [Acidimicrobiia bacterium]
ATLVSVLREIELVPDAEVTVECNPESVDEAKLAAYRAGGVTRLSFGVQSMVPRVLEALGRWHDPGSVVRAVRSARSAGFDAFNLDLVFGASGESVADWRETLEAILALDPPHVSAYALTVEAATPLARRIRVGEVSAPDEDDQAEKYELVDELLEGSGRPWYEISSWARPGYECRHHLLYWSQGDYLGIGCAAHGHVDGRRWWNVRAPERYIERVSAGVSPEAGYEELAADQREEEALLLAMRTRFGAEVDDDAGLLEDGLARKLGSRVVLTLRGRLLANEATTRILVRREDVLGRGAASGDTPSTEAATEELKEGQLQPVEC